MTEQEQEQPFNPDCTMDKTGWGMVQDIKLLYGLERKETIEELANTQNRDVEDVKTRIRFYITKAENGLLDYKDCQDEMIAYAKTLVDEPAEEAPQAPPPPAELPLNAASNMLARWNAYKDNLQTKIAENIIENINKSLETFEGIYDNRYDLKVHFVPEKEYVFVGNRQEFRIKYGPHEYPIIAVEFEVNYDAVCNHISEYYKKLGYGSITINQTASTKCMAISISS